MKILHVVPFFAAKFGGSVTVPYELSKKLAKRKHDVTIITTDFGFDQQYADMIRSEGVQVIPFPCIANLGLYLYSQSIKMWLKKNLKGFDIIHLHNYRSYQNSVVWKYAMKFHIPYIISPHASTPRIGEKKILKWIYDVISGYRLIRDASHIIAGSQEEKPYDIQMGARDEQVSIIYPGMDLDKYRSIPEKGLFKKKWGIDGKIILYLGRINNQKGIDFCIQAFADLVGKYDNLFFVIAGPDDGEKVHLEKLITAHKIEQNVIFTGFLEENEKLSAYVDADVFILTPIYMGGVGLTPLEAILCGTPVIVNDACGEVIKIAKCGYIVKTGDVNDLLKKMNCALENHEYNNKLVENGKRFIMENLIWEPIIQRVEILYEKCQQ